MRRFLLSLGSGLILLAGTGLSSAAAPRARPYPLVFESTRSGNAGLWLLSGSKLRHIDEADSPGHDCGPAFASDGRHLAFESNRLADPEEYDPTSNFDIYVLDVRTGVLDRLTDGPGMDGFPSWSPDARKIAFTREQPKSRFSIWVMDADGSDLTQLTHGDERMAHLAPAWSPDGKSIAYTVADAAAGGSSIFVMDVDGTRNRLLTNDGEYPAWSPDGHEIVFDSARAADNPFDTDLYVMRADGSHVRSLGHVEGSEMMPTWSPDGDQVAYVHDPDYWTGRGAILMLPTGDGVDVWGSGPAEPATVWQMSLSSGKRVQLSHGEADLFPRFSPTRNIG